MTILFSSVGTRVQLINCFREGAARMGLKIRALATDAKPELSAACQAADKSYSVPRCLAPDFIPTMLRICREEQVQLVVPTIDTELEVLAAHQSEFAAAGTTISVSSPGVVAACRNKIATSQFLAAHGVPTPRSGTPDEVARDPGQWRFPVILKPIGGSSSVGLQVVKSAAEFPTGPNEGLMAQELWQGSEYTVNLFFDRTGLRCAVPHRRIETRGGEVSKGRTERVPILMEAARAIGGAWKGEAFGALCFQAIVNAAGDAAVFEINARFGGGYPLAHQAGAPFARWLLEIVSDRPVSAADQWRENVLMLRYDSAMFIDAEMERKA
jgi:carbamoyl-phosphate synthase large subunit